MEKQLSKTELDIIKDHLASVIVKVSDRITLADTYKAVKDKIDPGVLENVFVVQLNKAIKDRKIPGLKVVRGRYGGIRLDDGSEEKMEEPKVISAPKAKASVEVLEPDPEPAEEEEPEPNEELYQKMREMVAIPPPPMVPKPVVSTSASWAKPAPVARVSLWIKERQYEIPHTVNEIKSLLTNVLEVVENPEGPIKFQEQSYACSESGLEFLDKFLFFFYGAALVF